ncbi:MAG: addiction module antidote protein, HigA family [Clostridia bacterium]|nr:addiction module antidote protein, HigA family [Clostridia bacterium]
MVKDRTHGLSRDLIIHPGESLNEMLEDRNMAQVELAMRTGVSEKHVSSIVRGRSSISVSFAKKLEYALGVDASFWLNLQMNYDKELLDFEEANCITTEERDILSRMKDIIYFLRKNGHIGFVTDDASTVVDLRMFLGVSKLTIIPDLTQNIVYRIQNTQNTNVDDYILYSWLRICEVEASKIKIKEALDKELLLSKLPVIKKLMALPPAEVRTELTKVFAHCGIAFCIVEHFQGAPVQGFIKMIEGDALILCITLRQAFADIFWFTLFHEIGHILNDDIKGKFIDFDSTKTDIEGNADAFARDILLDANDYKSFVIESNFALESLKAFAKTQKVEPFIVIGRLQKEGYLSYKDFYKEKTRYKWISN